MNETLQVIKNRRSIRHYKPDPIKDDDIKAIVEAGVCAPTAMNQQKWHFTVVRNAAVMDRMMEIIKANILATGPDFLKQRANTPEFNVFHHAPALIMITAEEGARFTEIDCGAAAENIALAAAALGIGTCLLGMPEFALMGKKGAALKKDLGIPDNYTHVVTISLGYSTGEQPPRPPKNLAVINYID